ncbi:MAG: rod shape-determining protein MreC [Chloroflexi bacterium]|nr:rod shape-determining protein MreC [Chloroflexota bacterium]
MRARQTVPGWAAVGIAALAVLLILVPGAAFQAESAGLRVLAPIEAALTGTANGVSRLVENVAQAGDLAAQNRQYREDVNRLQATIVQLRELELENQDLRRLLDLRERAPLGSLLSVNVIAQEPLTGVQAVSIDRGSDQGVAVNQPVISWRGVVGRTIEVRPTTSKVLLITDVNSAVSARIQDPESRATGSIRGTGDGRLLMQFVPRTDALRAGDTAITSGIGGVFPPGLVIGRVLQVRQRDVEVFQEALVEPSVDMRNAERLYVVLGLSGQGVGSVLGPGSSPNPSR